MALVKFEDVAADRAVGEGDPVADAAGNDADFVGADEERAKFGKDVEDVVLDNDEEVSVGRVEGRVRIHGFAGCEDENSNALLYCRIAGARDKVERVNPVHRFVHVKGIPSKLVRDLVEVFRLRVSIVGCGFSRLEGRVSGRRENSVEP